MFIVIAKDIEERRRALEGALKNETAPILCFDSEQFEAFLQEVETLPFFSSSKVVILQQVDELEKERFERLIAYAEKPSKWVSLYLTAASLPAQSRLLKHIKTVIRMKEERVWEKEKRLVEWVIKEARTAGVTMTPSVAEAFVKTVDSSSLQPELDKLICYAGTTREVTLEAMRALATPTHHETLWQLGEALFASQTTLALHIVRGLLEEEPSPFPLLAHLRTQFHTTLEILALYHREGREGVTQAYPYLKGGLLEKKITAASTYGVARLQQGLVHLFETELKAKNSSGPPHLLLEILIAKLTYDTFSPSKPSWTR